MAPLPFAGDLTMETCRRMLLSSLKSVNRVRGLLKHSCPLLHYLNATHELNVVLIGIRIRSPNVQSVRKELTKTIGPAVLLRSSFRPPLKWSSPSFFSLAFLGGLFAAKEEERDSQLKDQIRAGMIAMHVRTLNSFTKIIRQSLINWLINGGSHARNII